MPIACNVSGRILEGCFFRTSTLFVLFITKYTYSTEKSKRAKKKRRPSASSSVNQNELTLLLFANLGEALTAVHGTVRLGLERNLRLTAAGGAHGGEILTGAAGGVLAGVTAGLAALGLVLETALSVKLLLTGGEHELLATLFAN